MTTTPVKDGRDSEMREHALAQHARYRGKVQMMPKCPITRQEDLSIWYTPGVAEPSRSIASDRDQVYRYTNKSNSVAIVSDGSRVLGLGDIGPEAALPVMEGKALLFKHLGGVDAIPICIRAQTVDEIVSTVKALEPSFGGINLEDIAQPKCFDVLDRLREELTVPVWHDDQQGTAVVVLAALINALKLVGKKISEIRIAMIGMGAANVATYRLLKASGIKPACVVACDTGGVLGRHRRDIEERSNEFRDKWLICKETNAERLMGGIDAALEGADVCIAFSAPNPKTIKPEWVSHMNAKAIVFACANPVPEIWPQAALDAGAYIAATGRGDLPNQVNNALAFPGVFRGVLDVRASTITDDIAIAAATALADCTGAFGSIRPDSLLPPLSEWRVAPKIAEATAAKAQLLGLARLTSVNLNIYEGAVQRISAAQHLASGIDYDSLDPNCSEADHAAD